ncbi:MAG: outer membrane protein OmpA-like peptidoglycan-associated protein [Sulfitobacter sp.]|jgi:outer membrane protein OmpA-like peptidoglycan-associated protein
MLWLHRNRWRSKTYITRLETAVFKFSARIGATVAALGLALISVTPPAQAQQQGERYVPTIWVDPDGCEHWVMDDGVEGYMTPHVTRQGIPVCHRFETCAVMNSDQLFATDRYAISQANRQSLANFFAGAGATSYIIVGHTDSRASDAYNMRLSFNRANAVASVASQVGARIADVRGMGERSPVAANTSAHGMQQNRRVEIICIR